jgi:hypothetical protein
MRLMDWRETLSVKYRHSNMESSQTEASYLAISVISEILIPPQDFLETA